MSGTARHSLKLALVTILVGVAGGIGGGSMALLLHAVQHVTYGYSLRDLVGPESFLTAVAAVPPWHRALALALSLIHISEPTRPY